MKVTHSEALEYLKGSKNPLSSQKKAQLARKFEHVGSTQTMSVDENNYKAVYQLRGEDATRAKKNLEMFGSPLNVPNIRDLDSKNVSTMVSFFC